MPLPVIFLQDNNNNNIGKQIKNVVNFCFLGVFVTESVCGYARISGYIKREEMFLLTLLTFAHIRRLSAVSENAILTKMGIGNILKQHNIISVFSF